MIRVTLIGESDEIGGNGQVMPFLKDWRKNGKRVIALDLDGCLAQDDDLLYAETFRGASSHMLTFS